MTPSDARLQEEVRLLREELAQLRAAVGSNKRARSGAARGRATAWAAGTLLSFLLLVGVAVAAPAAPFACPGGDLYCFGAGTPALAAEVNSNFARLQSWLINKVGDLGTRQLQIEGPIVRGSTAVGTTDLGLYSQAPGIWMRFVTNAAPIRFFTDGGASGVGTTAALSVDTTGVTMGTANITTLRAANLVYTGEYLANAGASENGYGEAYMTSTTNSFCFMIGMRAGDDNDEDDANHCEIQVSGTTWWLRMWTTADEIGESWCKARCFTYR